MQGQSKKSFSSIVSLLEVGETASFPVDKVLIVRVMACNLGLTTGKKYATRTDREAGVITVTRTE